MEENNYSLACKQLVKEHTLNQSEWPMVELGEVCEVLDSERIPLKKENRKPGFYPYYGATGIIDSIDQYIFSEKLVLVGEDGAKWGSGDQTAFIADGKYWVNNHAHLLRPDKNRLVDEILIYLLNHINLSLYLTGMTVPKLNQSKLKKIKIPLPPLGVQEEIVKELDGYQKIIDGCRQVVENYKPLIEIDPSWEMVELGEVCEFIMGQSPKSEYYNTEKKGLEFHQGKIHFTDIKLKNSGLWTSKYNKSASKGSILISVRAPVGTVNITERDVAIGRGLCSIKVNKCKYNQKFLFYNLKSNEKKIRELSQGSTFDNINKDKLKKVKTPLPSLEVQEEIVNKIEQEREAINRCKWLIETYTKKIQDKIDKVWGTTSSQSYPIV